MSFDITLGRPGQFEAYERAVARAMECAALRASDRTARAAVQQVRAGLPGRLKNTVGAGSDQAKGRGARHTGAGFSASGWLHVRGRSARTKGAVEAATEGATIVPRRGQWLALPTGNIPKRAGRYKMTPDLYREHGFEEKIGPLEFIPGRGGREALLVVRGPLSVDRFGRGRAKRLPRRGRIGETRKVADFIVAFVLIRRTTRTARTNPKAIIAANAARVPALLAEELRKERI